MEGSNASGSTYPVSKWIFIGAKSVNNERDQKIKGVLVHELCHLVMRLVYENDENPYYKHREDINQIFKAISTAINKWTPQGPGDPDDGCDGIISTVYRLYSEAEFHLELIVRVVHILVQFDDDEIKSENLEE